MYQVRERAHTEAGRRDGHHLTINLIPDMGDHNWENSKPTAFHPAANALNLTAGTPTFNCTHDPWP